MVTKEGVKDFLKKVPGSKFIELAAASHMVAGDQNDPFTQAVLDFLEHDIRPTLSW